MSIYVAINHKTVYHYDRLINLSPHVFRLRPAAHCRTPIQGYSLRIEPEDHFINWQQDPFGNYQETMIGYTRFGEWPGVGERDRGWH